MTKAEIMTNIANYQLSVEGGDVLADALFANTPRDFMSRIARNPIVIGLRNLMTDSTAVRLVLQRAQLLAAQATCDDENQSLIEHSLAIYAYVLGATHEPEVCEFVDEIAFCGTGLAKFSAMRVAVTSQSKFGATNDATL